MKNRMQISKEIAQRTSEQEFYEKAKEFGRRAAKIFIKEKGKSQMSNLQNIVNSSLKVTDTIDYIKRQIGHGNRGFEKDKFGSDLIKFLYEDLGQTKKQIENNLSQLTLDEYELLQIHLLLCREFIKSLVVHYLYKLQEGTHANQ